MTKSLGLTLTAVLMCGLSFWSPQFAPSFAQTAAESDTPATAAGEVTVMTADLELLSTDSTTSAETQATDSTRVASPSAEVVERIRERTEEDITQPTETQRSRLVAVLEENPPGPLSWHNPLEHAILRAVENGLAANIIVLILLFPVIALILAGSRHIIGLDSFGIYIPAVLSVAFVSTGLPTGLIAFVVILLSVTLTRTLVKRLKMPYLPRTAMMLWGASILTLLALISAAIFNVVSLLTISIFPLLILILLTENFMETQLFSSQKKAVRLTLETLFIASFCAFIISQNAVQEFVILNPEETLVAVALGNLIVGRFTGLRLLEYLRFRSVLSR